MSAADEPGNGEARIRPLWAAAAVGWMAVIFALSSIPGPAFPESVDFLSRFATVAHFLLYAVLGLLVIRALGRTEIRALTLAVIIASLYGVSDEIHQIFVPGRSPDVVDWLADTLGALSAGMVLVRFGRSPSGRPTAG